MRKFKAQKNRVTTLMRQKKKIYVAQRMSDCMSDRRKMWKVLKGIFKNNLGEEKIPNPLPKKLLIGHNLIEGTQEKLNALNQHFVQVGTTIKSKLNTENCGRPRTSSMPQRNEDSIFLHPITTTEIIDTIASLKSDAAQGYDNISTKTMKQIMPHLATSLLPLLNDCLTSGHFPTTFKKTVVVSIYKGTGDRADPNNYRPVSIISNLSKILEKILYTRFLDFLSSSGFFANHQFGFLPGSNTTAAVLQAIDKIKSGLDEGACVAALFFDISKAFDCVDHALLLEEMERIGIRGVARDLKENYLFGRTQKIRSTEGCSEDAFMITGIPQGSALSTLLFLIYTNDLHE